MFCEKCGNQMPDDSKFCLSCGAPAAGAEGFQETTPIVETVVNDVTETVAEVSSAVEQPVAPAQPIAPPVPQPSPVRPEPIQAPRVAPQQAYVQPPQNQYYQQPSAPEKPEKIAPLKTWKFIGMFILTGIPLIGFIMILVWSFSSSFNKNTKSFARAILILWIIGLVLTIVGVIINWVAIQSLIEFFSSSMSLPY